LTLVAEAAIRFFIVGHYLLQRPHIGRLGLTGTIVYAYAFIYFTALVNSTSDWDELVQHLGMWMTIHGVLMVLGGLAFGITVARARALPRRTGLLLTIGVFSSLPLRGFQSLTRRHRRSSGSRLHRNGGGAAIAYRS
jgi:hypothetical protein